MSKTKAELLEDAQARGLDVSEDNTVAEIEAALEGADNGPIVHDEIDTTPRESEPLEEQPEVESLKDDDQVNAVVGDAAVHEPPVRSVLPDVPVLGSLAVGTGQHQPTDPGEFTPEGRPVTPPSTTRVAD